MSRPKKRQGHDPSKPFFLAMTATCLDGSLDWSGMEGAEGIYRSQAAATAVLHDLAERYGCTGYVYRCTPISIIDESETEGGPQGAEPKAEHREDLKSDRPPTLGTVR